MINDIALSGGCVPFIYLEFTWPRLSAQRSVANPFIINPQANWRQYGGQSTAVVTVVTGNHTHPRQS